MQASDRTSDVLYERSVAVLIPCFNEAQAIGRVVADVKRFLPTASVYVYDNNSTDATVACALAAGAMVGRETQQGKGNVIRRMFADIDADVFVLIDGDNTYDIAGVGEMVSLLISDDLDLVNGNRVATEAQSYRPGHAIGNMVLTRSVALIFGDRVGDMLSGLKVMSRRFVKSFPCLTTGFEIETEIVVHALELGMPLAERPVAYRGREQGSTSKLNTFRDGLRIARLILRLFRAERPLNFFGSISAILFSLSVSLGGWLFYEWKKTGLVLRIPTAILTTGIMLMAFLGAVCGLVLETVTLGRREGRRMVYLSYASPGARSNSGHLTNKRIN